MVDDSARGGLHDKPFDFRFSANGKVFITWRGAEICVLKGQQAHKFLRNIERKNGAEQPLVMAKVTANFKRGND